MDQVLIILAFVGIWFIMFRTNAPAYIAHWLNNMLDLPHPGPNDIQGPCSCRLHEGPIKYTLLDYAKQVIKGERK